MELTFIWFQLAKFIITIAFIYLIYIMYKKNYTKVSITLALLLGLFWVFMPIKYDGTNTSKNHQVTQDQRTRQYRTVTMDAIIIEDRKPTFKERMEAEELRSTEATKKTYNEIVK